MRRLLIALLLLAGTAGAQDFIRYYPPILADPFSAATYATVTLKDDFIVGTTTGTAVIGELQWSNSSFASGAFLQEAGHPGVWRGNVAAGPATGVLLLNGGGNSAQLQNFTRMLAILRWAGGANVPTSRWGLGVDSSSPPTDGVYFEHLTTDTNWFAVCNDGAGANRIDTGVAFAADTWITMEFRFSAGATTFYINGAAVAINATNHPAATLSSRVFLQHVTTGTASTVDFDYFALQMNASR